MSGQKLPLGEAIVVEGRYDKAKVSRLFDTIVVETGGFRIFHDGEKLKLIRRLAEKQGVIVLTDSDGAGFLIRNFLKGAVSGTLKHAYIPDIYGKERRKSVGSAEGKLGVEGIPDEIILKAVAGAGASLERPMRQGAPITRMDFYRDGLSGGAGSAEKRRRLARAAGLPEHLSAGALAEALSAFLSFEEYRELLACLEREEPKK